ncbi:MAG: hypothetical protein SGILL_007231 [Bacillariaceae sp.]
MIRSSTMMAALFLAFVASTTAVQAIETTPTYRVRSTLRGQPQPKHRDLQDPFLTFSEDGAEREDEFFLDLFETPAQLTNSESPNAIQTAMNFFLLSELSASSTGSLDSVQSVTSEILSLSTLEETFETDGDIAIARGVNVTRTGTEVRMRVYLTYLIKPSPPEEEVHAMMQQVMSNLTYFVTNLTTSLPQSSGEHELAGVYEANRRELPPPALEKPVNNTEIEANQPNTGETEIQIVPNDSNNVAVAAVPIILFVAVLVALVVFLVVRRRRREEPDESKDPAIMYMDVENELYSMDQSVETSQSPNHAMSPDASGANSIQYSTSGDEESMTRGPGDSIFSGIDTEYQNVRSSKSMMTGFTRASASTIQVSNKDRQMKSTTPKSYGANSSLFAFSEEQNDIEDDRDDRDAGLLGGAPSLTQSDISETSEDLLFTEDEREQEKSTDQHSAADTDASTSLAGAGISQPSSRDQEEQGEVVMQLNKPAAEETQDMGVPRSQQKWCGSSQVLADLGAMETNRRDPTPTMARAIGNSGTVGREATPSATVGYNIFNCNPVVEDNKNLAPVLPAAGVLASAALDGDAPRSPQRSNSGVSSSMPTPQLRNGGAREDENEKSSGSIRNSARSLMNGIFRGGRKSLSNPPTPSKSKNEVSEGAASAPSSPNKQIGGHWMTSTYPSRGWRGDGSPKLEGDEDYDMNLSRPSTPGDELDDSIEYVKDDSYGFLPKYANHDPESTTGDAGRGRRHVGDHIGGDGSAMYQTSAMAPLDWSLKSGDLNSVGESTISEKDDIGQGRYIFKKGRADIQTQGSLSPDNLEDSKTPRSEATRESVNSRVSASRQLINDLVWLEKKIAGVRQAPDGAPAIEPNDSLSYASNDNDEMREDSDDEEAPTVSTGQAGSVMSSIVCRDCYAPPGKLHIVIHSTKDGPAVHTVKEGSSLEGHIFPGDLIISVDNIDTRSYTAEQVMKMMASKGNQERKITVLHFEEEE